MYRARGKVYPLAGEKYRSRYEVVVAETLRILKITFEYEPKVFNIRLPDGSQRKYIPDFYLPTNDMWLEVKGYVNKNSTQKFAALPADHKRMIVEQDIGKLCGKPYRVFSYHWKKHNYAEKLLTETLSKRISDHEDEVREIIGLL